MIQIHAGHNHRDVQSAKLASGRELSAYCAHGRTSTHGNDRRRRSTHRPFHFLGRVPARAACGRRLRTAARDACRRLCGAPNRTAGATSCATADRAGDDKLGALGRALAAEFTLGGATPLWTLLSRNLVEEFRGPAAQRADAVIVVRTVDPQQDGTARFLTGLLGGLGVAGTPVVGVEQTNARLSAIPAYASRGLSTVDDVDQPVGLFALALLLTGTVHGQYGVKDTASSGVLPSVEPLTVVPR